MAERRLGFMRSTLHPALAIGLPFAFLQAMDAIVRRGIAPGTQLAPVGSLVIVLLVGISQSISANVLGRERISGFLPRARELVVTLIASAALVALLTGRPFHGDFSLQADLAWPVLLCLVQWLLTAAIQSALRSRELFLQLVEGKAGHTLVAAAHDAGGEAGLAIQSLTRLRSMAVILQVFAVVPWIIFMAVIAALGQPAPSGDIAARVLLNAAAGFAFIVIMHGFMDEHTAIAAGITRADAPADRRFAGPLLGVAVLFLLALSAAGARAVLPLSLLAALFEKINKLGEGSGPPPDLGQGQAVANPNAGSSMVDDLGYIPPSPGLQLFFRIVGIVLAAAAAAGFLYFVVRPLLRRGILRSARRFHPLKTAARSAAALLRFLREAPGRVVRWLRAPGRNLRAMSRALASALRGPATTAREREEQSRQAIARAARSRAVREFRRLSKWGERGGIRLHPSEAPMDYALRLRERAPAKEEDLREAARVFESLVYGPSPSASDERSLARLVTGIVK
jgi:hypothetical protein